MSVSGAVFDLYLYPRVLGSAVERVTAIEPLPPFPSISATFTIRHAAGKELLQAEGES